MKRIAVILIVLMSGWSACVSAGSLSTERKRLLYYDILELLDRYEASLAMLESEDADAFLDLFVSGNSTVYNDLLSVTTGRILTAGEYSNALRTELNPGCRIFLKDIMHDNPTSVNDSLWEVTLTLRKEILYFDQCDIKYSSSEHYQADYQLAMYLVWNQYSRQIQIDHIDGTIDSESSPLPHEFVVLDLKNDARYGRLLYLDNELACNTDSIVFLPNEALTDRYAFSWPYKDDIRLSVNRNTLCSRKLDVEFDLRNFRIRPHYETCINSVLVKMFDDGNGENELMSYVKDMGVYDIVGNNDAIKFKSEGFEAGIDFGLVLLSGRVSKPKLGLYGGIGISRTVISNEKYDTDFSRLTRQDMDMDEYWRYYDVKNIRYTLPVTDIVVPLYFDLELPFSPKFALYADAGVKLYWNIKRDFSDFEAQYKTYGKYDKYNGLELNEDNLKPLFDDYDSKPFNGFVNNGHLDVSNLTHKHANMPDYWFDAVGEAGFRFKFSETASFFRDLYFNLGISYQYTINPYVNDSKGYELPDSYILYYLDTGERVCYNITDYISEISRTGSIRSRVSLTYRF